MKRIGRLLAPAVLSAALLLPFAPTAGAVQQAPATTHVSAQSHVTAVSRDSVLERAATWLTANGGSQVPYSQTATWDGYRTDCSGYASMALQLAKPGPNTVGLASSSYSTPIGMADLQKGDLVIDAVGTANTRHVVIFEAWTDSSMSSYWAYEQRGGHGTDHRQLTYGLGADEFDAYRPNVY